LTTQNLENPHELLHQFNTNW